MHNKNVYLIEKKKTSKEITFPLYQFGFPRFNEIIKKNIKNINKIHQSLYFFIKMLNIT